MDETTDAYEHLPGTCAISYEISGRICYLRIHSAPVNALRFADWAALTSFYAGLHDRNVAIAVITGLPGRHFCAGNDFTEFSGMSEDDALTGSRIVRDVTYALRKSPVITIAAMHGAAMGGGLIAASACDIRLGTRSGKIGLPEVKVGAFGGYRIVQDVLPAAEARLMAFSGDPMANSRAYELGFYQSLFDTDDALWDGAVSLAKMLDDRMTGPLTHAAKTCVYEASQLDFEAGFDREIATGARVLSALNS